MIDYKANFQTDGANFPATAAINVSVPGAGDGTEFKALMVIDEWGARQAIMDYAGLTPNAASETYTNSQFLTALKNALSPVGMVIASHTQQDPATLGLRFLELVGQGILRASYPDLDSACYVGDSRNPTAEYYYRADDSGGSSRNTTGVYLILPDMRGAFARGYDPTATRDPDGTTRGFPDFQDFAMQDHHHDCISDSSLRADAAGTLVAFGSDVDIWDTSAAGPGGTTMEAQQIVNLTVPVLIDTDETRAANVQVKWWIRY
jgi:hypothetical protein